MILVVLVIALVLVLLSRRAHRKTVEHDANVVAQQPLTDFAARFPRGPRTRTPRRRKLGGF